MSKTVYSYHATTGEYIGTYQCQPDPRNKGEYLMPAHATEAKPPVAGDNEAVCFDGGKWTLKPDYRGRSRIDADTFEISEIKEIGEPSGIVLTESQLTQIRMGKKVRIEDGKVVVFEEAKTAQELRAMEYPDRNEFLDGYVKMQSSDPDIRQEGERQLAKYCADCLAVNRTSRRPHPRIIGCRLRRTHRERIREGNQIRRVHCRF